MSEWDDAVTIGDEIGDLRIRPLRDDWQVLEAVVLVKVLTPDGPSWAMRWTEPVQLLERISVLVAFGDSDRAEMVEHMKGVDDA